VTSPVEIEERVPGLDLSVGAFVVYGGHGIGRVTSRGSDATVVVERLAA